MRKLHIINLGKMGGVERLFLQYIHDNTAKDDIIFCISNEVGPEIAQHLRNKKVIFVNRMLNDFKLKYPGFVRKYVLQAKLWLANPDVTIVWDLIPGFTGTPSRGKVIYYDHGCSWRYAHNPKTLRFFAMLDGCISAAWASKRVMELRFKLTCRVQPVINRIVPPSGIERGPKAITSPLKLGIAARQVGLKGISVALLAVRALRDRGVIVTLDIAGKGPDEAAFRALAKKLNIDDCVNFLGFKDDLSRFFNNIHIYLSTPVTEPFGLSCMEALFYGVPVIFPCIDGQPEVIKDGVCGIGIIPKITPATHQELTGINVNFPHKVYSPYSDNLVDPLLMSHEDIADAVQKIASTAYSDYRNNAFSYVSEHFNHKNFVGEFNATINNIVGADVKK